MHKPISIQFKTFKSHRFATDHNCDVKQQNILKPINTPTQKTPARTGITTNPRKPTGSSVANRKRTFKRTNRNFSNRKKKPPANLAVLKSYFAPS